MQSTPKGKFIVIYGINNLGKSTQARLLVDRLNEAGIKTKYVKYPIYQLKPSGVILNNYLRGGNTYDLSDREIQAIYALNRSQFEPELKRLINNGINIIAEDYTGTGLAWGAAAGFDLEYLKHVNSHLLKEDLAFLFYGQPFKDKVNNGHKHERDVQLTEIARLTHDQLAEEFNWIRVKANQSIRELNDKLFNYVYKFINENGQAHLRLDIFKKSKQVNDTKKDSILVRRLSPIAKLPRWNPDYHGFEVFAADYLQIAPGELVEIDTGLKVQLPPNMHAFIWNIKNAKLTMSHFGLIDHLKISHKNQSGLHEHLQPGELIARLHLHRSHPLNIQEKEF